MPRDRDHDRTALVLAGGAARGAYEVGVVEYVLTEVAKTLGRDVGLDILSGTSVGALNACGLAAFADLGRTRASRLVDVWTQLDVTELVRPDVRGVLQMGARLLGRGSNDAVPAREGGLIAPEGLERLITHNVPLQSTEPVAPAPNSVTIFVRQAASALPRNVVGLTGVGSVRARSNRPFRAFVRSARRASASA